MFDTIKFGNYLSRLRKNADMTQSDVAMKLNVTRQAISHYECGDSFPDISILVSISDLFNVSLDELIRSGEPSTTEAIILTNIALGNEVKESNNIKDLINLAPLLKPSLLEKLANRLNDDGIDISGIVELAKYLNDESIVNMLEKVDLNNADNEFIEKLIPVLNNDSLETIFARILDGKMDYRLIKTLRPYAPYLTSQIEAAVIEGVLPNEVLCWFKM